MKTIKHFAVAALLVLGATLSAGRPAYAQEFYDLTSTGAEPTTAGQFALTRVKFLMVWSDYPPTGWSYVSYQATLHVRCQGLTPGAWYSTSAGKFRAASDGTGSAKTTKFYFGYSFYYGALMDSTLVEVSRINADGSQTLVLSGSVPDLVPRP